MEFGLNGKCPSRPDTTVQQDDHDIYMKGPISTCASEESRCTESRIPAWKSKLLDDHKKRLAKRRIRTSNSLAHPNLDLRAAVDLGVARGILVPPTPEVSAQIDLASRIKQVENNSTTALLNVQKTMYHRLGGFRENTIRGQSKGIVAARKTSKLIHAEGNDRTKPKTHAESVPEPQPGQTVSNILEPHQVLPPDAYFEKTSYDEKPAWRCGIAHAMGYYYNAGDKMNCLGCFTHVTKNPRKKWMDFYLPSKVSFYQSAPGNKWRPSKYRGSERRSKTLSHNSIAKDAFWDAYNAGASADEARKRAVEAVEAYLDLKKRPAPAPEPTPKPTPEPIDLGYHPSGSKTLEHGQDFPESAYWEREEDGEQFAWRCDLNHALGRYYLSGDKKHCPGCGSGRTSGVAKNAMMDFYLPSGVVVRQEAPGLVEWKPRRPYNLKKKAKKHRPTFLSHNQICAKKYWEGIGLGRDHDAALELAIRETDELLDALNEETREKQERIQSAAAAKNFPGEEQDQKNTEGGFEWKRASNGGLIFSLVPQKRGIEETDEEEYQAIEYDDQDVIYQATSPGPQSSDSSSSSSSDSE